MSEVTSFCPFPFDPQRLASNGADLSEREAVSLAIENATDSSVLPSLAKRLEEIDGGGIRGCGCDAHRWYDVPRCTCPKTLNGRLVGQAVRLVSELCDVHGQLLGLSEGWRPEREAVPMGDGRGNVVTWLEGPSSVRCVDVTMPGAGARMLHLGMSPTVH